MYAIEKIYLIKRAMIKIYELNEISPVVAQEQAVDVNDTIYLAVKNFEVVGSKTAAINYSRLITDTDLGKVTTWEQLAGRLTDQHVIGYEENMPGYLPGTDITRYPVQIWDVMNVLNTCDLDYGDATTDRHGILPYKYNLPDLRVKLQERATVVPQLNTCLPIVNGFACRPTYNEKTGVYYALDGARLCWQTGEHRTPEVQLIDFTLLGDTSVHPIYMEIPQSNHDGFVVSYMSRTRKFDLDATWVFTSKKYDLREYTPIVSIGGILILPDRIQIVNEHSFKCDINKYPWDQALAYKKYLIDQTSSQAHMFYNSTKIEDYIKSQMTKEGNSTDTFVFLVHTPRMYVNRIPVDIWQNGITINLYTTESLLLHDKTNTFRTYHCETFSDHKELILQNMEALYVADHHFRESQLVFVSTEGYKDVLPDLQRGNCTLVHLMGGQGKE